MNTQSDISDILGQMTVGKMVMGGGSKLEQLLKHFSANDIPLAICADGRHLGRQPDTLKRYARRLNLKFPDYVPRHMRPKREKKAKAA